MVHLPRRRKMDVLHRVGYMRCMILSIHPESVSSLTIQAYRDWTTNQDYDASYDCAHYNCYWRPIRLLASFICTGSLDEAVAVYSHTPRTLKPPEALDAVACKTIAADGAPCAV